MAAETENVQAPNWLSELEKKREVRLKARLGHEAGAGASCIRCEDKCPGLDLHFWRKICKNCKCSKEDHDVHDDDIYGWAQFQLLGSKPHKIRKKIVLPGKKDEVELEWAPKGNSETIDEYLKSLAPESLPVKGSAAAQERKQLLQKQIPIHDIDPSLCHELTDSELSKMQDYIKKMKNSAGVGQVVQFGLNYGNKHTMDSVNHKFVSDRFPKGLPTSEIVQLMGENTTGTLTKHLDKLAIKDQKELDAFFDKVPKPINMTAQIQNLGFSPLNAEHLAYYEKIDNKYPNLQELDVKHLHYAALDLQKQPNLYKNKEFNKINKNMSAANFAREHLLTLPEDEKLENANEINKNLHFAQSTSNIDSQQQNSKIRNLNTRNLHCYTPSNLDVSENQLLPNLVNIGAIRDINYEKPEIKAALCEENLLFQPEEHKIAEDVKETKQCRKCSNAFAPGEFAILVEKSNYLYHSRCFKCAGCNQNLADLFYFYDRESDDVYCGRDFAKIRGIPRCHACDELIFVKEYCLAENCTYHLKHFCCFECDEALAGQNYIVEESQPVCLPCFEKVKANKCLSCGGVIRPDEEGVTLKEGIHFHSADQCFCCWMCKKVLHGAKILFRNNRLYCSHDCFNGDT